MWVWSMVCYVVSHPLRSCSVVYSDIAGENNRLYFSVCFCTHTVRLSFSHNNFVPLLAMLQLHMAEPAADDVGWRRRDGVARQCFVHPRGTGYAHGQGICWTAQNVLEGGRKVR